MIRKLIGSFGELEYEDLVLHEDLQFFVPANVADFDLGPFYVDHVERLFLAAFPDRCGGAGLHEYGFAPKGGITNGNRRSVTDVHVARQEEIDTAPQSVERRFGLADQFSGTEPFGQIERMVRHQNPHNTPWNRPEALQQVGDLSVADRATLNPQDARGVDAGHGHFVVNEERGPVRGDDSLVEAKSHPHAAERIEVRHVVVAGNHQEGAGK